MERLLAIRNRQVMPAIARIWLGFGAVTMVLTVTHLFRPITWIESTSLTVVGLTACLWFGLRSKTPWRVTPSTTAVSLIVFACALWICAKSAGQDVIANYDGGLYHFQTIRWTNEFPAVWGVGNLHERLAFNQSFFTYVAFLNFYPLFSGGHLISNSFLLLLVLAECLWAVRRVVRRQWRRRASVSPGDLLFGFVLVFCVKDLLSDNVVGTTPDITLYLLEAVAFGVLVRLYEARRFRRGARHLLAYLVILAAVLVTTKLSALVFSGALVAVAVFVLGRQPHLRPWRHWPWRAAGLAGLLLLAHGVNGAILSGYPLFPSTTLAVPGDWRVPEGLARNVRIWIRSWARWPGANPEDVLASWAWLRPWFKARLSEKTLPLLWGLMLMGAGLGMLSATQARGRLWRATHPLVHPLIWPLCAAAVFWFFAAPDLRLLGSVHVLAGLWPLCVGLTNLPVTGRQRSIAVALAASALALTFWVVLKRDRYLTGVAFTAQAVPESPTVTRRTRTGLIVRIPAQGDQCWGAELPCTPYFRGDLELRGAGLGTGFRLPVGDSVREQDVQESPSKPR
jgi:hypothetical protein